MRIGLRLTALSLSHLIAMIVGIAIGIYALPIITAPPSPTEAQLTALSSQAIFRGEFRRDLKGSDTFHWGEGQVSVDREYISLMGSLAPGPDYKLYLSPEFVETEEAVERLMESMAYVGEVDTFDNFIVALKPGTALTDFNTVVIWCESFGEFITAARYR